MNDKIFITTLETLEKTLRQSFWDWIKTLVKLVNNLGNNFLKGKKEQFLQLKKEYEQKNRQLETEEKENLEHQQQLRVEEELEYWSMKTMQSVFDTQDRTDHHCRMAFFVEDLLKRTDAETEDLRD